MVQIISVPFSENFLVYNSVNNRINHNVVLLSKLWKIDVMEISLTKKSRKTDVEKNESYGSRTRGVGNRVADEGGMCGESRPRGRDQ